MPLHRRQPFDSSPPSVAITDYSRTLQSVFRQAVGYALASAIGASGCSASHEQASSQPSVTVTAPRQGAPNTKPSSLPAKSNPTDTGNAGRGEPIEQPTRNPSVADAGAPVQQAPRPSPVSVECPLPTGMPELFAGLTSQPFDAAQFRVQCEACDQPQIWFGLGILCGAATDLAACQSQVDAAGVKASLMFNDFMPMFGMTARYVLTTLGNEAHKFQNRDELLQFLGPIDSPQDALLLLYYDQRGVLCPNADRTQSLEGVDAATFVELDDGYQVIHLSQTNECGNITTTRATLHVARDGTVTETASETMEPEFTGCAGRRPEGLQSRHVGTSASALGEHFARMAHLEEASIAAFEVLATELASHGAPDELVAWARRSAADEVRHTATTRQLARRFGVSTTAVEVAPAALRSLEAIAIDNAREGCVRECFGAALGCYQAQTAADPEIAAMMAEIADDETRHAALAFAIDAWVQSQLDDDARARIAAVRAQAVAALRSELACAPDADTRAALGLPDATAALRLCSALEQSLWAA